MKHLHPPHPQAARLANLLAALALATLVLGGCALEVQNAQPARELARAGEAPGSAYTGWRVYQAKCARCHGTGASGGPGAPDLLARVRTLGPRAFVSRVLTRYAWEVRKPASAGRDEAALQALVDDVMQRRQGALTMPAWQAEPSVNAHIMDLYAYLSARAQGTLGEGRPAP